MPHGVVTPPPIERVCLVCACLSPCLWMTSHLHTSWGCSTSLSGWGSEAHMQPWARRVKYPLQAADARGYFLQVALGVLNIYDIMLAHHVLAHTATRKWWRVLKVLSRRQHRGGGSLWSMTALFMNTKKNFEHISGTRGSPQPLAQHWTELTKTNLLAMISLSESI